MELDHLILIKQLGVGITFGIVAFSCDKNYFFFFMLKRLKNINIKSIKDH